ncbi:hypothetical protein GOP47_0029121 [Adiantum capillus-veneris]|nr:hypothetical protein GOP47_0029121 [Adiantum capillus-veneris]
MRTLLLLLALRLLILAGSLAQLLCDLDQIQVTQTLVANTSSSTSSYLYGQQKNQAMINKNADNEGDNKNNGGIQQGGAIFHVKVANNCPCSAAAAITFYCDGFMPGLVRTDVLRVEGARCLLIEGEALIQLAPVRFDYASPHQLPLLLESADFTC